MSLRRQGTYFSWKPQPPMEHSGARNCSLKEDIDATLNILVSRDGHSKPKDVNLHRMGGGVGQGPGGGNRGWSHTNNGSSSIMMEAVLQSTYTINSLNM